MPAILLTIGSRIGSRVFSNVFYAAAVVCLEWDVMFFWGPATLLLLQTFWTYRGHRCWLFNQLPAAIIPSDQHLSCVYAEPKSSGHFCISDLFYLSDLLNFKIITLKSARLLSCPICIGQTQCCVFLKDLQIGCRCRHMSSACVTRWMDCFLCSVKKAC